MKLLQQPTPFIDANGRRIKVGDYVQFTWWVTAADGLQHEHFINGRIVCRRGHLCFEFRDTANNRVVRRLSALCFDSEQDMVVLDFIKKQRHDNDKRYTI